MLHFLVHRLLQIYTLIQPNIKLSCFSPVSEDDVCKIINESPTKLYQLDPWPTFLVKNCFDILIKPITSIVNMSLSEGVFVDTFKQAIVTPLIKKPSLPRNKLKNLGPIFGLSFISKVIK